MSTDETRVAFADLSDRAEAMASSQPLDRISVRDLTVAVEIGAFQAERDAVQRVRFNVVVEVQPVAAPLEDDVDRILSYDKITEAVHAELAAERLNLLETLAERVADRILAAPQAVRVFVRIEKLDRGPGNLGVEIVRDATTRRNAQADLPRPRVVYLSEAAAGSERLADWLGQLADAGAPLVLCVGPGNAPDDTVADTVADAGARAHILLLAMEQAAWVLAAQVGGLSVVGTRTELEWAMRNGQTCVWAPSKLVLDAVDGPDAASVPAIALADWFAHEMHAVELVSIGETLPQNPASAARYLPLGAERI